MTLDDLDKLLRDSQRVILSGRNYYGKIEWTVDVITDLADGHETAEQLQAAVDTALRECKASSKS